MSRIIACVNHSPCDAAVLRTAESLAPLIGATVDAVNVERPGGRRSPDDLDHARTLSGDPVRVLLDELRSDDVVLGVIGSRSVDAKAGMAGHVATELLEASPVPLAVVSPGGSALPADHPRLLIPLDGGAETNEAVAPLANTLTAAGASVVFLHVFDSGSLPPFVSSPDDVGILAEESGPPPARAVRAVRNPPRRTRTSHRRCRRHQTRRRDPARLGPRPLTRTSRRDPVSHAHDAASLDRHPDPENGRRSGRGSLTRKTQTSSGTTERESARWHATCCGRQTIDYVR